MKEMNRFKEIKRTRGVSTTNVITKLLHIKKGIKCKNTSNTDNEAIRQNLKNELE